MAKAMSWSAYGLILIHMTTAVMMKCGNHARFALVKLAMLITRKFRGNGVCTAVEFVTVFATVGLR